MSPGLAEMQPAISGTAIALSNRNPHEEDNVNKRLDMLPTIANITDITRQGSEGLCLGKISSSSNFDTIQS
jgi:hypothetical protein